MAAWARVEDEVDPAVEIGRDMRGGRRAHPARAIGRRSRERDACRLDQRPRRCVRRRADRHAVEAGAREQADPRGRRDGQHKSEGSRPERAGERLGLGAEQAMLARRFEAEDMGDERVDRGPLLGGVDRGDRGVRGRVRREAVDGLGRHGDETAGAQACRGGGDRLGACLDEPGHPEVERHISPDPG